MKMNANQYTTNDYQTEYSRFSANPEKFWLEQASRVPWYSAPATALGGDSLTQWFPDGMMNTSYMALDFHIEQGRGQHTAVVYDSPVTATKSRYTYCELRDAVAKCAGGLAGLGVGKGDRVVIYMPMVPEALISMLACARLGAIHSVVFGGFAAHELAARIEDAQPKVIISASCGVEIDRVIAYKPLLDKAIELSSFKPESTIILQRPQALAQMTASRDRDWQELMSTAMPVPAVPVKSTDPLYILYTSGTTGKPKGVVRDNGGHAVAMHYSMEVVYGAQQEDVFLAASDIGWVVGHSYIVYAPLIYGCTTVLYEGKPIKTPDAGAFWRMVEEYKVSILFSAPTAFRAIKKADPHGALLQEYDLSSLKRIFLAGERLDPPTYDWLLEKMQRPILDHWWQTETGWAIACNPVGIEVLPSKAGSATVATPGYLVSVLDSAGNECSAGEQGNVVIKQPLPPGCLPTIWNNPQRFEEGYLTEYPGYYLTGDGGYLDDDGYLFIMGRTDDVINVAGHRLSTGEMEEILAAHPAVAECAVFGVANPLKGQLPIGLVVLKDHHQGVSEDIVQELILSIRQKIGAIACFKAAYIVERLPKTRSGKILRKTMRQIADGDTVQVPSTIDDASVLDELKEVLAQVHSYCLTAG